MSPPACLDKLSNTNDISTNREQNTLPIASSKHTTIDNGHFNFGNLTQLSGSNVPSSFNNTQQIKGLGSHSNDHTMKTITLTDAQHSTTIRTATGDPTKRTRSQDGNYSSSRAIESYQRHLDRQSARVDRQVEAE